MNRGLMENRLCLYCRPVSPDQSSLAPRAVRFLSLLLVTALLGVFLSQVPVQAANPPVAYDQCGRHRRRHAHERSRSAPATRTATRSTYTIVTDPIHGDLTGTPPNVTYTPDANYNGSDSFTFQANDGGQDSNIATVSITVIAVNDAPVADGQAVTTNEDTPQAITLTASDVDSDSLTFTIVASPSQRYPERRRAQRDLYAQRQL